MPKKPKRHIRTSKTAGTTGQNARKAVERAEAPNPDNKLSDAWQPFALVLIVDHRECACGQTYTCPNPKLMLEAVNRRGATRMVNVGKTDLATLTVPRILREVHTECSACPECFEPEPNGRPARPLHTTTLDSLTPVPTARPMSIEELIS